MPEEPSQKPAGLHLSFQPTLTLGTVLHVVVLAILLIAAWTHVTDRLDVQDKQINDAQRIQVQLTNSVQQLELNVATDTTVISELERRLTQDETKAK